MPWIPSARFLFHFSLEASTFAAPIIRGPATPGVLLLPSHRARSAPSCARLDLDSGSVWASRSRSPATAALLREVASSKVDPAADLLRAAVASSMLRLPRRPPPTLLRVAVRTLPPRTPPVGLARLPTSLPYSELLFNLWLQLALHLSLALPVFLPRTPGGRLDQLGSGNVLDRKQAGRSPFYNSELVWSAQEKLYVGSQQWLVGGVPVLWHKSLAILLGTRLPKSMLNCTDGLAAGVPERQGLSLPLPLHLPVSRSFLFLHFALWGRWHSDALASLATQLLFDNRMWWLHFLWVGCTCLGASTQLI